MRRFFVTNDGKDSVDSLCGEFLEMPFTLLTDPEVPVKYGVRLSVSMTCGISGIYAPSDPFTMRWR